MTRPYPGAVAASLELLDGVRWRGEPVAGDRVAALLCALALQPAGVSDQRLVEWIWADEAPANPVNRSSRPWLVT